MQCKKADSIQNFNSTPCFKDVNVRVVVKFQGLCFALQSIVLFWITCPE